MIINNKFNQELDKRTIKNCDFVKVGLMVLIVLYHSMALWITSGWFNQPPMKSSIYLNYIARWLNTFHIYTFTFVSGYIFSFLRYEMERYKEFKSFFIGKIRRLLIPYMFSAVIWVVPWNCYFFNINAKDIIKKYILGLSPSQLWFLLMLFIVFIIAYFLSDLIYNRMIYGIITCLIIYGIGLIGGTFLENYFQIFTACKYFIFFYIGIQVRHYGIRELNKLPLISWIILDILLFIIYMMLLNKIGTFFKIITICIEFILHIVGCLMTFIILNKIASKIEYEKNKLYIFLKKYNFTIYLFHQQVIYWVITLFNGKVSSLSLVIMNFVIAMIVSSIIAMLLGKTKITRILSGIK
ncbi:acyltransferase family protein [Clostridium perfringens]|nr:acyltransferase family protein [Clostridium perfringens]EIF6166398.1 acyltransferase family protein [Clostridium perfringens]ELQ0172423.1 acyltransferase family protein [Clostridium perfringens]ELQ0173499.1 acyltransferase family protein [Clostridium perfringens]MDU2505287.1 acyltransferase [Clostridium perfringens]